MSRPFMISFPFKGKTCYANVYIHNASVRKYQVDIIGPEMHTGLPPRINLTAMDGQILSAEPLDISQPVLQLIIEKIREKQQ